MTGDADESVIDNFRNEYAFLSNFYPVQIQIEPGGLIYPSSEHAFQAEKCANVGDKVKFLSGRPSDAKRRGHQVKLRKDWEAIKYDVMNDVLRAKFGAQHPDLQQRLIDTGTAKLIEGNTWHDGVWGVCSCGRCRGVGRNLLGRLLMAQRDSLNYYRQRKNESND